MAEVTIDQIEARHSELTQLIAKFKSQSQASTLSLPAAQVTLLPGEKYAGAILKDDGAVDYHLALLPAKPDGEGPHKDARSWAKCVGGKLPNKREIRLLQANLPGALPTSGCTWLEEEEGSSHAWCCGFDNGYLGCGSRSAELGAVAVRRFNP